MALRILVMLAAVLAAGFLYLRDSSARHYSPMWLSQSTADARARGVLVHRPVLAESVVRWRRRDYLIEDVWIEAATRVHYRWLLFEETRRTGENRLIARFERGDIPAGPGTGQELGFNDSIPFDALSGNVTYARVTPPYPDSIRIFTFPSRLRRDR